MKNVFLHIFAIPSSSRHEKCCRKLVRLFWLFQCSRIPQLCYHIPFIAREWTIVFGFVFCFSCFTCRHLGMTSNTGAVKSGIVFGLQWWWGRWFFVVLLQGVFKNCVTNLTIRCQKFENGSSDTRLKLIANLTGWKTEYLIVQLRTRFRQKNSRLKTCPQGVQ